MNGVPVGPSRVWLATADSPGLSMSRAFGDALAATVGVTDEPDLVDVALGPADRYLLLASDGVFEFMEARARGGGASAGRPIGLRGASCRRVLQRRVPLICETPWVSAPGLSASAHGPDR